jgi:hypothetical protein
MIVIGHIRIKMYDPVTDIHCADLSDIPKKHKIPVDGSETDSGECFPHTQIYGFGGGMIPSGLQKFIYRFSLSAVFQCHMALLIDINNCY